MAKFNKLKTCVYTMVAVCLMLTWYALVEAAGQLAPPAAADAMSSKDIIMILFGMLQTVFMAIGVWLISNDKELFTRMGKAESEIATRKALCDDRNEDGEHHHKRASDTDTAVALKESVDMLRRALHSMLDKGDSL